MKKSASILVGVVSGLLLSLSGCSLFSSGASNQFGSDSKKSGEFESMYKQTLEEYTGLDKEGGAWVETSDMLDNAVAAAKVNDYNKAMKLLNTATEQTKLARAQFEAQRKATSTLF